MKRHVMSGLGRQFSEVLATGLLLAVCVQSATGQLAITEVMSNAAGSGIPDGAGHGSDFWELTNFGDQPIDLDRYQFTDRMDTPRRLLNQTNDPLVIGAGESVVFVRMREVTSEGQFRDWWGSCLPAHTKVRVIMGPGFDNQGDIVRVYDPAGNLVDQVEFGVAREGVTFVYDTNTGAFGTFSVEGTCGACKAWVTNDIGSPGTTCGRVPLGILSQPSDLTVCAGTEATLSVRAAGMPPPKCQWYFENAPISGATNSSLTIRNAGPADSGQYYVLITNGLSVTQSVSVTLTVSTNASPPIIVTPPVDMLCYTGQTARFAVTVCAYPLPSYQWLANGVPLPGATERILRLTNASFAMSGEYCVQIANSLGATTACARLTVTAKPEIRITELMPEPTSGTNCAGHGQWFELTNQGTNAVNLLGCRFSDRMTLTGSVVITNDIIVQPGESVIFAERMSADEFARWWGADNLPPGLKVFRYVGLGFAPIPTVDDEGVFLWNAASEDRFDCIDFHTYAWAQTGVSLVFDCLPDPDALECWFGADSEVGRGGAFRAIECGDIGSPGYTTNPPPRFVGIARDGTKVTVRWRAVEGRSYRLSYKDSLADLIWQELRELSPITATNSVQTATDDTGNATQRFYRLQEELQ